MINLLFITLAVLGLVFLFFQQRMNSKQEVLIKSETKALKKLRKNNQAMFLNKPFAIEERENSQPEILMPKKTQVMPQVRNFEFPKALKRRSKTSVISN